MAIARGFAATATFVGLAVGAASTAWADLPTMNGNYTEHLDNARRPNPYHRLGRQSLR